MKVVSPIVSDEAHYREMVARIRAGGDLSGEVSSFATMATAANERLRADMRMLLEAGADRDFLSTFLAHAFAKAQLDLAGHLLTIAADETLRQAAQPRWAH